MCSDGLGLFFKYDISPIMIKLEERYVSMAHLITRVFAVVGGNWRKGDYANSL
jgi:hypothetical protein